MTDADYEATRQRILGLAEKWLGPLGLKWWSIDTVYDREGTECGPECAARVSCRWEYAHGSILWNMPLVVQHSDEDLERIFVHECMHFFLHETRAGTRCECEWDIRHEERVATMLQKAFLWVYAAAFEAGERAAQACKVIPVHDTNGRRVDVPVPLSG
jgi:hypothetical protein